MPYQHLTQDERYQIAAELAAGLSMAAHPPPPAPSQHHRARVAPQSSRPDLSRRAGTADRRRATVSGQQSSTDHRRDGRADRRGSGTTLESGTNPWPLPAAGRADGQPGQHLWPRPPPWPASSVAAAQATAWLRPRPGQALHRPQVDPAASCGGGHLHSSGRLGTGHGAPQSRTRRDRHHDRTRHRLRAAGLRWPAKPTRWRAPSRHDWDG